jgi:hypothetical protein
VGKKKATGMSKRLGFTDRATINENKDILRYNDRLEREAQGLPPEEPRRRAPRAGGRPDRGPAQDGETRTARPEGARRPPRQARPPRPPGLDEEQTATLGTAYRAVVGESGLELAADKVIERIAAHDSFERATMAGWEVAAGAHAGERTAAEWELLRTAWLAVRMALLEAYATFKPEAAEALAREQKQQARLAKPPRPRRRPGKGPDKRRPAKPPAASGPRTPSPADVARHVAAHGSTPEEATAALTAEFPSGSQPSPETTPIAELSPELPVVSEVSPGVEPSPEVSPEPPPVPERDRMSTEGADPETDVALPYAGPSPSTSVPEAPTHTDVYAGALPAEAEVGELESSREAESDSPASEHEAYASRSEESAESDRPDDGQMALDL